MAANYCDFKNRIILVSLSIIIQLINCVETSAQGKFYLNGTINKKFEGGYIKLLGKYKGYTGFTSIRSEIIDGKFAFYGEIDREYELVFFEVWKDGRTATIDFFIKPDTSFIEIENIDKDQTNNLIKYNNIPFLQIKQFYSEYISDSYKYYLDQLEFINTIRKTQGNTIADSLKILNLNIKRAYINKNISFVRSHPDNFFALHIFVTAILNERELDSDSLYNIYRLFNAELKNTAIGRHAYEIIDKKGSVHVNKLMPNFSFKTNDGTLISTSDFLSKKYVLICFWASCCKGCIENIPLFTQIEKEYRTRGLQVISISIDVEKEKWVNALRKHPMPWLQTCDIASYVGDQKLRENFDVDLVPQYFLLDKKGQIVYHSLKSLDLYKDDYTELKQMLVKMQEN